MDTPYPIVSTSKLMTCLLAMEAISAGQLSMDEQVTISDACSCGDGGGADCLDGEEASNPRVMPLIK